MGLRDLRIHIKLAAAASHTASNRCLHLDLDPKVLFWRVSGALQRLTAQRVLSQFSTLEQIASHSNVYNALSTSSQFDQGHALHSGARDVKTPSSWRQATDCARSTNRILSTLETATSGAALSIAGPNVLTRRSNFRALCNRFATASLLLLCSDHAWHRIFKIRCCSVLLSHARPCRVLA